MRNLLIILFIIAATLNIAAYEIDYEDLINWQKDAMLKSAQTSSRHYFDPIVNEVYPTFLTMPMLYSMFNCTSVVQEYADSTGWVTVGNTIIEYSGDNVTRVTMSYNYGGQMTTVIYDVVWAGGQISHIEMSMDYMGSPTVMGRESYTWVTEGVSTCTMQYPDLINGGWVDSELWTYTYNGSELTEVLIQEYGMMERPEDSEKYVLSWSGGHVATMTLSWWNGTSWENDENELFTYDGDNMTVEIDQYWESASWMNDDKTEYTYTGVKPVSWNDYSWDSTDWYNDSRGTITYNNDDKPTVFLSQELVDVATREWVDSGRLTYGYGVGVSENTVPVFSVKFKNYPNPFNPQTTLEFSLSADSNVELSVYNLKGQLVSNLIKEEYPKGTHSFVWNADRHTSGVYLAVLKTKFGISRQKLVLLK